MSGRSAIRDYTSWLLLFGCAWWIVLIPLDYNLLNFIVFPFRKAGECIVTWFCPDFAFASDSLGMYALLLLSAVLAFISAAIASRIKKTGSFPPLRSCLYLITFFLSLVLIKYGWIKIVKLQFYLPEPNILYTRFGMLSKDIAWWSLMGTSRPYSIATGVIEIVAGVLLLFNRTRFIGLLASAGIFANVLLINLSFDISVKLFSATLLAFSLTGLLFYRDRLKMMLGIPVKINRSESADFRGKTIVKAFAVTIIVLESLYPTVVSGNLNDDSVPRPAFHGAYRVVNSGRYEMLYIHRANYLVLEDKSGRQLDYRIKAVDGNTFSVTDERTGKAGNLEMYTNKAVLIMDRHDTLMILRVPYRNLPLMKENLHLFSDRFH